MQLILQTANVTADAKNCSYPNKVTVTNASELQESGYSLLIQFKAPCDTKPYKDVSSRLQIQTMTCRCRMNKSYL